MEDKWSKIKKALEHQSYRWRTLSGISEETSIDRNEISKELERNRDVIVISSRKAQDGSSLYTTRSHYRKKTGAFTKILSSIKNRVE